MDRYRIIWLQYRTSINLLPLHSSLTDTEALSETTLPDANPNEIAADPSEASMSSAIPLSSSPPRANGGMHTAVPPPIQFTLEDHRLQLTHQLNALNAEHSNLTSSLKTARKESQKADAALRSEIDTLKRASDRYTAGESRSRLKILALQHAVKQTLAAAHDIEALIKDIEVALPGLEERREEIEKEWVKAKEDAKRVQAMREEAAQREKARSEATQSELSGLANRLEKLNGKREKLEGEGGVLAELEAKLRKLEEDRERIERDPYGYEGEAAAESEDGSHPASEGRSKDDSSPEGERPHSHPGRQQNQSHAAHPHFNNFHPHQHQHPRKRHSHPHTHNPPHAHHHPRPSFPPPRTAGSSEPAHRPAGAGARASFPMGNNAVPGVIHLPPHGHTHRKNNQHRGAFHAHAHAHANANGTGSGSSSASSTPITSGTPGASTAPVTASANGSSNLSSRAPPFEPSRSRAHSQSHTHVSAKSELNPGSTPFAPRAAAAQAVASSVVGGPAGKAGPAP